MVFLRRRMVAGVGGLLVVVERTLKWLGVGGVPDDAQTWGAWLMAVWPYALLPVGIAAMVYGFTPASWWIGLATDIRRRVNRYQERHLPFGLQGRESFTFGEIDWEYQRLRLNLLTGEILEELMRGYWLGEFEKEDGTSPITLSGQPDVMWNRRMLLAAFNQESVSGVTNKQLFPAPDEGGPLWESLRQMIPWQELAKRPLEDWGERAPGYFNALVVPSAVFRRWLRRTSTRLGRIR